MDLDKEIERRYKDEDGGYDLQRVESFLAGVELASTHEGILNVDDIAAGYNFIMINKLQNEYSDNRTAENSGREIE